MNLTLRRVALPFIILTFIGVNTLVLPVEEVQASTFLQESNPVAVTSDLAAVGRVELIGRHQVVLETSGIVNDVAAEVGDLVEAGDIIMALETSRLEDALERAEIGLETARIGLEELTDTPEESDVAVAEANLLQARENLALVSDGPTDEELQAQANKVEAAWARHALLKEGPTPAQINQTRASLAQAEVNLQEAQREYDKIAWLPEAAATDAADNLQRATIAYEAAKAGFEEASKPTERADLLSALSAAQSAQDEYNRLKEKPTPAALADAQAQVAAAEAALDKLTRAPDDADVRMAELTVRKALLDLDQAELNLQNASVRAPIDGTILDLSVEPGQSGNSGSHVATLADTNRLKLVVNVEQTDISQVIEGQPVAISLYAFSDRIHNGVVERIAPVSETETGSVTFPVTILFTDEALDDVRPGMTASASFLAPEDQQEEQTEGDASSD